MQEQTLTFVFDSAKVHSNLYKEESPPTGKQAMAIYVPKRLTEPGKPPMRLKVTIGSYT